MLEFPDAALDDRIERIKADIGPLYTINVNDADAVKTVGDQRIQDAWAFHDDVKAIATNAKMLELLK